MRTSGSGEVLARVGAEPALVIATPGAEPVAEGRYAAVLLLDAWALLDRPSLEASAEALRRWTGAAALGRGVAEGGVAVLAGAPTHTTIPAVEALVRWDPAWLAGRELDERAGLGLPPTVTMAQVVGPRPAVAAALEDDALPDGLVRLGPLPYRGRASGARSRGSGPRDEPDAPEVVQVLLRTSREEAPALARGLHAVRAGRSARKEPDSVLVRMTPADGT